MKRDIHDYQGIIDLPRHVSKKHPHMSIHDRAAQFVPFAALAGHGEAISETDRLTERKKELDADVVEILDRELMWLRENLSSKPEIMLTYYIPDERKYGGHYITLDVRVIKIDDYENCIYTDTGLKINVNDIFSIEII